MAFLSLFYYIFVVIGTAVLLRIMMRIICMSSLAEANSRRSSISSSDRQGNVFTIHDEAARDNRYDDIFFIEPNSAEAARIRAQQEKDDKDLPSYEEVLRMTAMQAQVASPSPPSATTMGASNASVNTAETMLPSPPYSEVDPYASTSRVNASVGSSNSPAILPASAGTSAAATVPPGAGSVVIAISPPLSSHAAASTNA